MESLLILNKLGSGSIPYPCYHQIVLWKVSLWEQVLTDMCWWNQNKFYSIHGYKTCAYLLPCESLGSILGSCNVWRTKIKRKNRREKRVRKNYKIICVFGCLWKSRGKKIKLLRNVYFPPFFKESGEIYFLVSPLLFSEVFFFF